MIAIAGRLEAIAIRVKAIANLIKRLFDEYIYIYYKQYYIRM